MKSIRAIGIALLIANNPVFAQTPYTIQGNVSDGASAPIAGAFILLQDDSDHSVLKTGVTDSTGHYAISYATIENTSLTVTAPGFLPRTSLVKSNDTGHDMRMDFFLEQEGHVLSEVVISGSKPMLERKADRIVFNVASSVSAAGSHALEMIGKAPGVIVNPVTNSINLAGKGGVRIMVNGIMLQLSGDALIAYLQAIPAEDLERIEILTTPPSKYDASGNSGLINLVLKRNTSYGVNGLLRAGYGQASHSAMNGGGNLNFRKNKWNVFGGLNYSRAKNTIVERLNTPYISHSLYMEDRHIRTMGPWSYTLGVDYELHKNAIVGITFQANNFWRRDDDDIANRLISGVGGNVDSLMHTLGKSRQAQNTNALNLNYEWKIDTTGKMLSINVNRLWYTGLNHKDFETQGYAGEFLVPVGTGVKNQTEAGQKVKITTAQADMQLPYKTGLTLSFGGKISFIDNNSHNHFRYFEGDRYLEDPSLSDAFDYSENIQALYTSIQRQAGKWEFQVGLRGEFAQTKGYSISLRQSRSDRYFQLFPTAYVLYRLNDVSVFNMNYSRRVNRPGYGQLNPFRNYSSPYFYSEGNPLLRPYFSHNIEWGYSFGYRFFVSAFYQFAHNGIGQVWVTNPDDNITYMQQNNTFDNQSFGLSAMLSLQPVRWWELQAQASCGYEQQRSTDYPGLARLSLPTYYFYANNTITLNAPKTFFAEVTAYYSGKSMMGFFECAPAFSMNGGFKGLFLDKDLTVSIQANDVLNSLKGRKAIHRATGQTLNNDLDVQDVRLSVSYKVGSKKIKSSRNRRTGIEEEKGRM